MVAVQEGDGLPLRCIRRDARAHTGPAPWLNSTCSVGGDVTPTQNVRVLLDLYFHISSGDKNVSLRTFFFCVVLSYFVILLDVVLRGTRVHLPLLKGLFWCQNGNEWGK